MIVSRIIVWTAVILICINIVSAANANIEPGRIELNDVLVNSVVEKEIAISITDDETIMVKHSIEGDIKGFTTISPDSAIPVSSGKPAAFKLTFSTDNLEPGEYTGEIKLGFRNIASPKISSSEVIYSLPVKIILTNKKKEEVEIKEIRLLDAEQGSLIDLFITTENKGNVKSQLVVDVNIKGEKYFQIINLLPFEKKTDILNMDSTGLELGRHGGQINVFLDNALLISTPVEFDILMRGILISHGELLYISNKDKVHAGDTVLFNPVFVNDGQKSFNAQFKGDVYFNSKKIGEIESDEVYVHAGETARLSFKYIPALIGTYSIRGKVFYGNSFTAEKEAIVNARPENEDLDVVPLGATSALILILVIISLFVSRKVLKKNLEIKSKTKEKKKLKRKKRSK